MEKVGAYTERVSPEGEWRAGNPATGERATPMLSSYFNMLQRELLNILNEASIAPSVEDETQLAAAIGTIAARNAVTTIDGVAAISIEEA